MKMIFEAGPWYCFGKEMLDCLYTSINKKKLSSNKIIKKQFLIQTDHCSDMLLQIVYNL